MSDYCRSRAKCKCGLLHYSDDESERNMELFGQLDEAQDRIRELESAPVFSPDSPLSSVTPGELKKYASSLGLIKKIWLHESQSSAIDHIDRAAAILRALADVIEKTEGRG